MQTNKQTNTSPQWDTNYPASRKTKTFVNPSQHKHQEDEEQRELSYIVRENVNGSITLENSLAVSLKLNV